MQLVLLIGASLLSLVQGSRYGLLRVGSSVQENSSFAHKVGQPDDRSLFEEDISLAFRQLFVYQAGLSLSMAQGAAAQLSLSMVGQAAQLSMGLAPLSLSFGAGAAYGSGGEQWLSSNAAVGITTASIQGASGLGASSAGQAISDGEIRVDTSTSASSKGLGPGSIATVSAFSVVAAVAVAATLLAMKRNDASSSASSTGSVSLI